VENLRVVENQRAERSQAPPQVNDPHVKLNLPSALHWSSGSRFPKLP
jgi:hypothetical protein